MAYRLKKIHYQNSPRYILLQNENGPCPLIAAANALLLRGSISLRASCTRSNVISADDLTTMLADRALVRSGLSSSTGNSENKQCQNQNEEVSLVLKQRQQQVDEMMEILPNLQYGLDVNPRFTKGVMGAEFTVGLTAFDALGVDLVHGWLVDPTENDGETFRLIGSRSYNEVVEVIINGNEASSSIDQITKLKSEKETELAACSSTTSKEEMVNMNDIEESAVINDVQMVDKAYVGKSAITSDENRTNICEKEATNDAEVTNSTILSEGGATTATKETYEGLEKENKSAPNATEIVSRRSSLFPPVDDVIAVDKQSVCEKVEIDDAGVKRCAMINDGTTNITEKADHSVHKENKTMPDEAEIVARRPSLFPPVDDIALDEQSVLDPPLICLPVEKVSDVEKISSGSSESELSKEDRQKELLVDLNDIRDKLVTMDEKVRAGQMISQFLDETGHQLTYHGLQKLRDHLKEEELCVFFRNNHFSTLGKKDGKLYLLVTDLGYAGVEEVVWEKLDNIKGDTDYVDCFFQKPQPRSDHAATRILDPEHMLAQKGQHELDYQLAMRLQSGKKIDDTTFNDEEAALMAAATERSLNEWKGTGQDVSKEATHDGEASSDVCTSLPMQALPNTEVVENMQGLAENSLYPPINSPEDNDRKMALQLQQQYENDVSDQASELLARRLYEEESNRQRNISGSQRIQPNVSTQNTNANNESNCSLS